MTGSVEIEGLDPLTRGLGKLKSDLPNAVLHAADEGADSIVAYAVSRIRRRTGRAGRSVKARHEQAAVRIVGGGRAAPYFGWLDFGGRVGRKGSVVRPFESGGRYILAGYRARQREIGVALESSVADAAARAGLA